MNLRFATWQLVIRRTVPLAVFSLALGLRAASDEETLAQLRQFRYGQDAAVLTRVEDRVAKTTARQADVAGRRELARELAAILQTDASFEAKQFVCRQLAIIGTAEQIPALARMLTDDPLSDMARYALGAIPDRAADRAFREALGRTTGKTQIGIINTLGARRDAAAAGRLGQLLKSPDLAVASAAARALGHIGGPEAATALKRVLANAQGDLRSALAEAYLACARDFLARKETQRARSIGEALVQPRESARTRAAALGVLAATGANAARFVVDALRDPDPTVHRAALGCVRLLSGRDALEQVADEMPQLPASDQVVLLAALADSGEAVALTAAETAARSGDNRVRLAAFEALGRLGNSSMVPALVQAASVNTSSVEKETALAGLRALRGPNIDAGIVQALQGAKGELRAALIGVLADRSAVAAIPALTAEARGHETPARQAAFRALAQLGSAKDLPGLVRLLAELPDDQGRAEAEQAVMDLAMRSEDGTHRADAILAALDGVAALPARCSLLRVLGGLGTAKGLRAIVTATADPETTVQDTAVRELANWQEASALDPLARIFQSTANATHRILALRGYLRLVGSAEDLPTAEKLKRCREAMTQIRGTDEKKLVLAGLGGIADAAALKLVLPYLDDETVRTEASEATLQIARAIYASDREEVKQALGHVVAVTTDPQRRQQAEAVLRDIEVLGDYITDWQVAGPYSEPGKDFRALFDLPFPPENTGAANVTWRELHAGADPSRPWVIDLLRALGGDQRVAYLRTRIYSDRDRDARLDLGSDDGVKAWVNGKVVHANNVARALTRDSDHVNIALRQGWNLVLLKVTQNNQGWECCARLRLQDGGRIPGVRIVAAGQE